MSNIKAKLIANLNILVILIMFNIDSVKLNHEKKKGTIYMLLWSATDTEPFRFWSTKRHSFKVMNCEFQNCFIVKERGYFQDLTDYDAILFTVKGLGKGDDLPLARSDNQIYVFVALESPFYFPFDERWNRFFNYTWTYKLDSDIFHPYFIVRNKHSEVVGPKINARWRNITVMKLTPDSVKEKLKNKNTAAAWFVTNCHGASRRLDYGHVLNKALGKYNLNIDIYGQCGHKQCSRDRFEDCFDIVESRYYFYLAFENSFCEDYVTEKLMTALDHYSVPVVLGGANYSRFMPDGIYLNGNLLSEEAVAEKINEAIRDKQIYYDYFRWHGYYTYQFTAESYDTDPLCSFCSFLNDESTRNERRVYARFDKWWNQYRSQDDKDDIIERYDDSYYDIKSVLTYTQPKLDVRTTVTESAIEEVNGFVGDLFNYYFGSPT